MALVIGICYLLLAACLGVGLILFHRQHLPRGSRWGIVNAATTASDNAWIQAHRAAAPLVGATAVLCVIRCRNFYRDRLLVGAPGRHCQC